MTARTEKEIFSDLARTCASSGYVHAIAYLCFRDDTIKYSEQVTSDDVLKQYSPDRLIRTEISTLIGLAGKADCSYELPPPDLLQEYVETTDQLLKELHHSMIEPTKAIFDPKNLEDPQFNPFNSGEVLREAIFYGGESAYHFQYRDLSLVKYAKDNQWFIDNKGYSVEQAFRVVVAIQKFQNEKLNSLVKNFPKQDPEKWSFLTAYTFTPEDVSAISGTTAEVSKQVIESFTSPHEMNDFNELGDFNPRNAYPVIQLDDNEYLLFQTYSLVEAFYETPFFWFNDDSSYKDSAMQHRGEFTEEFSAERLSLVFGTGRVFQNCYIHNSSGEVVGEIDVLVTFGNRAVVLQAKSKKLTIAARKGNDNSLQSDFKKAVQDAYDQAYLCAEYLCDSSYSMSDQFGQPLNLSREYKAIFPFCIVSDHYPALSFQARQFLSFEDHPVIKQPFVMDVFLLDVMTEMLQSPLHFLSYVDRRALYGDKVSSTHELTVLAYHLSQNLWFEDELSMVQLGDDVTADLDLAITVRRDGIDGEDTPKGILTLFQGTAFESIISEIDCLDIPATIDLGFMLLFLGSETIETINTGIEQLNNLGQKDGKHHDLTLGISEGNTGLTIHCNNDSINISGPRLEDHCARRKYTQKADTWYGVCIKSNSPNVRFGVSQEYPWVQSDKMDRVVRNMHKANNIIGQGKITANTFKKKSRKIGRNELCPCGSGIKYKKCCLGTK